MERLCKLLLKHRIPVYTSCVGNQLPGALPCVLSLNELSRRLLSETSDLLPASLPLKFLPLSSSPSSFSSYFRIQKGNFLLITLPLHISFYSCVMLFINCLLFMVLSLFLLYPTQTQRERSIYIVLQLYTLCGLNRWGKLFCCAFEDTENKAIKDSQVLMF